MSCIKSIHLCLWNISFNSKHPYSQPEATTDLLFVITNYVGRFWRRQWHTTPVLLPGKSHGRRSLVGCSPWGRWELDTTQWLHFHFLLSCIGEGNGNPLQCSCLENPRDGGAWWAAVYGVAQSRTRLKWLSSSSSKSLLEDSVPERTDSPYQYQYFLLLHLYQQMGSLMETRLH